MFLLNMFKNPDLNSSIFSFAGRLDVISNIVALRQRHVCFSTTSFSEFNSLVFRFNACVKIEDCVQVFVVPPKAKCSKQVKSFLLSWKRETRVENKQIRFFNCLCYIYISTDIWISFASSVAAIKDDIMSMEY